jgi:diguanylate cyclase (GGDEF)-like protein
MPSVAAVFDPSDCWALRRSRVHRTGQDPTTPRCAHLSELGTQTALCVPLMAQGDALGVLTLVPSSSGELPDPLNAADRERIVTATAEQVSLALANLRLRDRLRSQTIRDPLTGLFNRRFLEESLDRECRRAIRGARPLSLIMIDVDFFKHFNDTFGHAAGDSVLREVGGVLRGFFRGEDVACRYGGEEFAIVLADTGAEGAAARAHQLRDQIHQLQPTFRREVLGRITISAGVSTLPLHAVTAEALIRSADQALYRAKSQGRDRVVVADAPTDKVSAD